MAKYAISKEGAEALSLLANNLLINANNIVEVNCQLEQVTHLIYDDLGIYGDDIIGIIQRNRQTLNNCREDIINLAQRVEKQARDVEELLGTEIQADGSRDTEKHGGISRLIEGIFGKNDIFQSKESIVTFGNGLYATRDKMDKDRYFINGNHSKDFINYWTNMNEYTEIPTNDNSIIYINAKDIEGIRLSRQDIEDVEGFWGRRTGGTQETFAKIAQDIPKVKFLLDSGMDYYSICDNYPELSDCVSIYFESAPSVSSFNDFYIFGENGRHRELAAQLIDGIIPVKVKSIISRKGL